MTYIPVMIPLGWAGSDHVTLMRDSSTSTTWTSVGGPGAAPVNTVTCTQGNKNRQLNLIILGHFLLTSFWGQDVITIGERSCVAPTTHPCYMDTVVGVGCQTGDGLGGHRASYHQDLPLQSSTEEPHLQVVATEPADRGPRDPDRRAVEQHH